MLAEKRLRWPTIPPDFEPGLGIPILARQARDWQGITVEWEKFGPFELEPHGYPKHRLSLILKRCPRLVRKENGFVHELSVENGDLFIAPAGQVIGYRSFTSQVIQAHPMRKPTKKQSNIFLLPGR